MSGYFIALVVIGEKEAQMADLMITACNEYTQNLYKSAPFSLGGKWLMIEVKSKEILDDVIKLIDIRINK